MANSSDAVSQQASEANLQNFKNILDSYLTLVQQALIDNQHDARRRMDNAAAFDHFVSMGSALAAQVGVTQGQANVSPIRTAAADTEVQQPAGAVYPPIRNVDQAGAVATGAVETAAAGVATAAEGIATANQSVADAVANLMNALTAVIVTAAGGASTPSQTTPKPAT